MSAQEYYPTVRKSSNKSEQIIVPYPTLRFQGLENLRYQEPQVSVVGTKAWIFVTITN